MNARTESGTDIIDPYFMESSGSDWEGVKFTVHLPVVTQSSLA